MGLQQAPGGFWSLLEPSRAFWRLLSLLEPHGVSWSLDSVHGDWLEVLELEDRFFNFFKYVFGWFYCKNTGLCGKQSKHMLVFIDVLRCFYCENTWKMQSHYLHV